MTANVSNGAPTQSFEEEDSSSQCPFHVLGIALVVDEPGKGARLAFRYPVTPTVDTADDLFFTLPPLVMAKLFRPKKPLCGQPMTISVGGTVFCCRAILMDDDSHLDLFNVMVALAPTVPTSTIPVAGWFDDDSNEEDISVTTTPSAPFLAIRRVHVSIARLCRVLEREERRCQYVSLQSSQLFKIQDEVRQEMDKRTKLESTANSVDASAAEATQTSIRRSSHRRGLSGSTMTAISTAASVQTEKGEHPHNTPQPKVMVQYEVEQEILELLLANAPPSEHHGNLARELAQVYHALAWNKDEFLPTPSILLSDSHGIIYINRHVAVSIEPTADSTPTLTSNEMPRSYQTLLFPHASPKELVQTLSMSSAPQRLQQLLLMVNPRKALSEISMDAALPLAVTLELAAFLVKKGACVVSSVVSRSTKLACASDAIPRMQDRALDFSQEFGVSIHVAVSALTNGLTLGEIMLSATGSNPNVRNDEATLLGREITQQINNPEGPSPAEIEEFVYAMAVWLRSHQVVIGMGEYLVAIGDEPKTHEAHDSTASIDSWNVDLHPKHVHPEEALYNELLGVLDGTVSTVALCWRYEIDNMQIHRFRSWGVLHNKLRVLTRVPSPNDDWNTRVSEK